MIYYTEKNWEVFDPDKLLQSADCESAEKVVLPREDVLAFKHKEMEILIDFGFYGEETIHEGEWVVYVVGKEGWDNPIIEKRFVSFGSAFQSTINLVNEYSI